MEINGGDTDAVAADGNGRCRCGTGVGCDTGVFQWRIENDGAADYQHAGGVHCRDEFVFREVVPNLQSENPDANRSGNVHRIRLRCRPVQQYLFGTGVQSAGGRGRGYHHAHVYRIDYVLFYSGQAGCADVKYDLIGKLVDETGLTRKAVIQILQGIQPTTFNQFKNNPEEFIIKTAALINDEKATAIIEHITYNVIDDKYGTDVFTDPTIRGRLGVNAMKAKKHLYNHIVYDSTNEREFATELDTNTNVAVYVKLPDGFYISTPVGHYNPDWAIAFYEGTVKHIYFVAETKGSMNSMQLRLVEESKIHCAREHFKAISNGEVVYDVISSYKELLDIVTK